MTRDELIDQLLVERHNGGGWAPSPYRSTTPDLASWDDTDITTARRRRALEEAADTRPERATA